MNPPFKLPLVIIPTSDFLVKVVDAKMATIISIITEEEATFLCQAVNHYQEMVGELIRGRESLRQIANLANVNAETRKILIGVGNGFNVLLTKLENK